MQDEDPVAASHSVTLTSASGNPAGVGFEVGIDAAEPGSTSRTFTVTGSDPAAGARRTQKYRLPDTGHRAYLDFLEALARDFGTRVPQSRQRSDAPVSSAPF